jgi:hypothetical protein
MNESDADSRLKAGHDPNQHLRLSAADAICVICG